MRYTRSGIGLLNAQYRSVLKKCLMINLGLFALGAGAANAEDYALNAADLSTSKNITWKEISADEYDPNNKNMLKVDLSDSKSQYFKFTYTKPEGGTVYDTRQEGKEGALSGDITADFKDITSNVDGGALANAAGNTLNITGDFINNLIDNTDSGNSGGAIDNLGTLSIKGDMIGNGLIKDRNAYGGAISNNSDANITDIIGNFIGNYIVAQTRNTYGGAIFNRRATIGDITGNFIGNYAKTQDDAENLIGATGAIANLESSSIGNITGNFINNYAETSVGKSTANGGAIYNRSSSTIGDIKGDFIANHVKAEKSRVSGGAIYNATSTKISSLTGNFINNYASGYMTASGGAIINLAQSTIGSITGNFINNHADSNGGNDIARGGALHNSGEITSIYGDFKSNYALTNGTFAIGGAILNTLSSTPMNGITTLSGNFDGNYAKTTGTGNDAYAQGGAIYNSANMNIYDIQSATFNNNYVSGASEQTDGGAIWNAGNLGFSGSNVFKDNYKIVNGEKTANDIYNSGTISVAGNGSISVNGGITGSNGTINLAENAILNINDATVSGNNLTLEKDATLAFNVNEVNTADTVQSGGKVDGSIKLNADANLKVSTYVEHGADSGESTYKFADTVDTADGKWKLNTVIANGLYNYDFKLNDDSNTLIMEFAKKNADEIANEFNTSKDKADEILALVSPKSDNDQFNNISETVDKLAQASDKNLPNALDDLNDNTQANLETGRYMGDIIAKNVADRYDTHLDTGNAYGLSSGDVSEYEPEVWANAVYQSAENSGDWDYSADTKGVIAAVDGKAGQNWTLGAGYSYLQTDLDSGAKSSDVDDHAVFAYAEYSRSSWFANGLASYHWLSFDQNKKAFGENIKGSFDMQMLGLQAMVGKEFYGCAENHFMRLRPQIGVRYYKISQDGYADSAGMSYNDADSDVVTGVAGVSFTDETKVNGYYVMPKAFVNATYDLQNDDNTTVVNLPNGGSYAIAQESNGKFGIETGVGVEMKLTRQAKVGLTYEYDWRDDYSAHTGLLNLKYAF